MITQLELRNFTAFGKLEIKFSPKVNVIIGENGTGKTHLLKAAYGLCSGGSIVRNKAENNKKKIKSALTAKFLRLFMPLDNKLGTMHRSGTKGHSSLNAAFERDEELNLEFYSNSKTLSVQNNGNFDQYESDSIFIPTKEVFSLVKGLRFQENHLPTIHNIFDDSHLDLAEELMKPDGETSDGRINYDPRFGTIVPNIAKTIGGRYQLIGDEFCFQAGKYREKKSPSRTQSKHAQMYQDSTITKFSSKKGSHIPSSMTAEGFKKIGMLQRLLVNGALVPGTKGPLFWDEPEANMNPKLMESLVQVLLELSRNGQQIILATHDYVLLKWFDLLMDKGKGDHLSFHVLYRDSPSKEIQVSSTNEYAQIRGNAISDTYADIYDAEIERALGSANT